VISSRCSGNAVLGCVFHRESQLAWAQLLRVINMMSYYRGLTPDYKSHILDSMLAAGD